MGSQYDGEREVFVYAFQLSPAMDDMFQPRGTLRKVSATTQETALTRLCEQLEPGWRRGDVRLVWTDAPERVYGMD